MFIILVVVYFLVFDFFLIELCRRSEMILTNIMNTCFNEVILLKFNFFSSNFNNFLGFDLFIFNIVMM